MTHSWVMDNKCVKYYPDPTLRRWSDFQLFILLWNFSSISMNFHEHHDAYVFLLCLNFGNNCWKDKKDTKMYSDFKMANIISLFIDIATDQRAPQLPVLLITCCFLKTKNKLIWLCTFVFLNFFQWSEILHIDTTFTFNQLFAPEKLIMNNAIGKLFWSAGFNIYSFKECASKLKFIDILHQMITTL